MPDDGLKRFGVRRDGVVGKGWDDEARIRDLRRIPAISPDYAKNGRAGAPRQFEAFHQVLVSHPKLKRNEMKWEQVAQLSAERSFSTAMA